MLTELIIQSPMKAASALRWRDVFPLQELSCQRVTYIDVDLNFGNLL